MAWESHLSARTGFSSSLIGSEVPAEMERSDRRGASLEIRNRSQCPDLSVTERPSCEQR